MKRRILIILWFMILCACFLFWISGISLRLFSAAFASDRLHVLFYPNTEALKAAADAGYGFHARIQVLQSLFDIRFFMMAAIFLTGSVCLCRRDALEQKKMERCRQQKEMLLQRIALLEGRLQACSRDILARQEEQENLAHQMKSSLNSLSLKLELAELYDQVEESFDHMNRHLDKLLENATLHHNDRRLTMEILSLKDILEMEVIPELRGYDVRIEKRLSSGWLYGDRYLLTQALETLMKNACRHGNQILVTVLDHPDCVICQMENDTKIQTVPSLTRYETDEAGHYGIGLDLAKKAVRLHGGNISVRLENQRFIVTMKFPVHPWERQDAKFQKGLSDSMDDGG